MEYWVKLTAMASVSRVETIKADSEEQAKKLAIRKVSRSIIWDIDEVDPDTIEAEIDG